MVRRNLAVIFLLTATFLSGCATASGVAQTGKGLACGAYSTAEGMVKDSCAFVGFIQKTDDWIKTNLW